MKDVDRLDLLEQELGFVLKSEQREALELLLRGKDVLCVLPTGIDKSFIYQMFVHAKSSSTADRHCYLALCKKGGSVGNTRLLPHAKLLLVPMNCFSSVAE